MLMRLSRRSCGARSLPLDGHPPWLHDVRTPNNIRKIWSNPATAMATVGQDIFKPTKFGGKYTVTLIPGTPR
jgi:hypothetical protein